MLKIPERELYDTSDAADVRYHLSRTEYLGTPNDTGEVEKITDERFIKLRYGQHTQILNTLLMLPTF